MGRSRLILFLAIGLIAGLVLFVTLKGEDESPPYESPAPTGYPTDPEADPEVDTDLPDARSSPTDSVEMVPDADPRYEMRAAVPEHEHTPSQPTSPAQHENSEVPRMPLGEDEFESTRRQTLAEAYGEGGVPRCDVRCDCAQGQQCTAAGFCMPSPTPVYCCENFGCPEGAPCHDAEGLPGICDSQQ